MRLEFGIECVLNSESIIRSQTETKTVEKQHFNWSRIPLSSRTINYKFDIFL